MEDKTFITKLEDVIKNIFPKSGVSVKLSKGFGTYFILRFTLGADSSEYPNKIIDNDPAYHTIMIDANKDGTLPDTTKVEGTGNCGRIYIKSKNPYKVYDGIKIGWRDFSGNEQQILKRLDIYFKKVKDALLLHADEMDADATKLIKDKYGKDIKENLNTEIKSVYIEYNKRIKEQGSAAESRIMNFKTFLIEGFGLGDMEYARSKRF